MSNDDRRSVPGLRKTLPRALTDSELATAGRLADVLCTATSQPVPPPSECIEFADTLAVAIAARIDVFDEIVSALARAAAVAHPDQWLRELDQEEPLVFASLSTVLAGAYLMVPSIQSYVGYQGQGRHPAPPTQIGEELADGLLDPVIDRGPIYRTP